MLQLSFTAGIQWELERMLRLIQRSSVQDAMQKNLNFDTLSDVESGCF